MKNIPIAFRVIINIFLYIIYTVIWHFIFGLIFAFVLRLSWKKIPISTDPVFTKIAIVASFFILVLTLVFRKYFYITLEIEKEEKYIEKEKSIENNKQKKQKKKDDETMKIYIEKEINNEK